MKTGRFSVGFAFDGDADRCLVVDEHGNTIDGDMLLAVFARDGLRIVAGLGGETYCGWLFIRYLWVSNALRGKGIGRELMGAAEGRALERGCHSAWVDTFSFQAPAFYSKLGYDVFGELDYPPDHKRFFLQKRLTRASGGGA